MVLVLTVGQGATLLPAVLCAGIGSALAILPCDLDPEQCLIRLHEEGETVRASMPMPSPGSTAIFSSIPAGAIR